MCAHRFRGFATASVDGITGVLIGATTLLHELARDLSDDVYVEGRHPQVLMSNRRLLPDIALDALQKAVAESATKFVWRRLSAWVDCQRHGPRFAVAAGKLESH